MDYSELKRGKTKDLKKLFTTGKGTKDTKASTIADRDLLLIMPAEYVRQGLVEIHEDHIDMLALACLIDVDNKTYYPLRTPIPFKTVPATSRSVTYDNMKYVEYVYGKGDVLIQTLDLIVTPKLVPKILSLLLWRAIIPFYLNRVDITNVLTKAGHYAGLSIDKNRAIVEVLVSLLVRNKKTIKLARFEHLEDTEVDYFGLANRAYSTESPFRLMISGNESRTAKVMLTKEPSSTTILEDVLRK